MLPPLILQLLLLQLLTDYIDDNHAFFDSSYGLIIEI